MTIRPVNETFRWLLFAISNDWEAKVSINGKQLGVHRGGYDAFSFDITAALKTQGAQEIMLEVRRHTMAMAVIPMMPARRSSPRRSMPRW